MKTPKGIEYSKVTELFDEDYKKLVRKDNPYLQRLQELADEKEITIQYDGQIAPTMKTIIRIECYYDNRISHAGIKSENEIVEPSGDPKKDAEREFKYAYNKLMDYIDGSIVNTILKIRKEETGEIRDYKQQFHKDDINNHNFYIYEEGNYACDCNRSIFFGEEDYDSSTCSDHKYSLNIVDAETGEVYYREYDE